MRSKYIGVTRNSLKNIGKPWRTQLSIATGKAFYLGQFETEEAARAYDNAVFYLNELTGAGRRNMNFPNDYDSPDISAPDPRPRTLLALEAYKALNTGVDAASLRAMQGEARERAAATREAALEAIHRATAKRDVAELRDLLTQALFTQSQLARQLSLISRKVKQLLPEDAGDQHPAGKTLVEVFAAEEAAAPAQVPAPSFENLVPSDPHPTSGGMVSPTPHPAPMPQLPAPSFENAFPTALQFAPGTLSPVPQDQGIQVPSTPPGPSCPSLGGLNFVLAQASEPPWEQPVPMVA